MKVVFCSSEVFPFAKTGGLGDVCGALPIALSHAGVEVVVFLPAYKCIDREKFGVSRVEGNLFTARITDAVQAYFIEHEGYFHRDGLYNGPGGDYPDNLDRFTHFCRQVFEGLKKIDFKPDIIHCHDWQTAMIPVLLHEHYRWHDPFFKETRTFLTIHNIAFQGVFPQREYGKLGLPPGVFNPKGVEFYGKINLLKGGILYADEVSTVSRQYACEIQTDAYGCGLQHVIRSHAEKVTGIINGVDYEVWNPQTDPLVAVQYGPEKYREAKAENKRVLQRETHLPQRPEVPVFGFVGRLAQQKGIDLILDAMEGLMHQDIQIIIQGVGDGGYMRRLGDCQRRFNQKLAVSFTFNEHLAHQIYAGSDMFLMPSTYEPCGLSQLISMRYGTVPLVSRTGGLVDTVIPFDGGVTTTANGFMMGNYCRHECIHMVDYAAGIFRSSPDQFALLIANALAADFSWDRSAEEYRKIYECLLSE